MKKRKLELQHSDTLAALLSASVTSLSSASATLDTLSYSQRFPLLKWIA